MFWGKVNYNVNICDHNDSELMIHLTKVCDNNCPFCIDKTNHGVNTKKPDIESILFTMNYYLDKVNAVTISGGEPLLYMDEVIAIINAVKTYNKKTNRYVKLILMTACPKTCWDNMYGKFLNILEECDYIGFSVQHCNEVIANAIRGKSKSDYDRQTLYEHIPLNVKHKITININVFSPFLDTKEAIEKCVSHYSHLGYDNIKICEMFSMDSMYVDIPKILGITLNNPFSSGCKQDVTKYFSNIKQTTTVTLKRSCWLRTKKQHANFWDLFKMCTRWLTAKKYFFGVIHEDGTIAPYWI